MELNTATTTGYYGIPGEVGGPVHIVQQGRPVCGSRVRDDSRFQWCAHGVAWHYVECQRCRRIAESTIAKARMEGV